MNLSIPKSLQDVDYKWVCQLVHTLNNTENSQDLTIHNLKIEPQPNNQGVLSDICTLDFQGKIGLKMVDHKWFVKIVPKHFQDIVIKHRLFEKEVIFYKYVFENFNFDAIIQIWIVFIFGAKVQIQNWFMLAWPENSNSKLFHFFNPIVQILIGNFSKV